MRRRGLVSDLSMVGVSGRKFPAIRDHLHRNISQVYNGLDVSFTSYPADDSTDPNSFKEAIDKLPKGSAVTIFTPDSTHYDIALYAIERGHHVLITKPATKLLSDHLKLLEASRKFNVFVYVEHHKRFDPAYADARYRAKKLGDFSYWFVLLRNSVMVCCLFLKLSSIPLFRRDNCSVPAIIVWEGLIGR